MILAEVFERFVSESPLTVMLRILLEQSLSADDVDELFEHHAQRQYHRDLLFSTVVSLMSLVVCGISPSISQRRKELGSGFNRCTTNLMV